MQLKPRSVFHRIPQELNLIPLTALVLLLFFPHGYYSHFVRGMFVCGLYGLIFGKKNGKNHQKYIHPLLLGSTFYFTVLCHTLLH
jgi:hypothetical protein